MTAKPLTFGRIVYLFYYRPLALARQSRREGGPVAQWITAKGRREMQAMATFLPSRPSASPTDPTVCFLTGRRFWYQTAFCLWSLCHAAGRTFRAEFYDDGTCDEAIQREAARLFPGSRVVPSAEIEARLDEALPTSEFPILRRRRLEYPNLRKLTDIHTGSHGWKLVLDSDMLFFRSPTELLKANEDARRPLHMTDVADAYGYPRPLLESIAGKPLPSKLNVGVCGLRSEDVDWRLVEHWSHEMQTAAGTSYYQEQALVAMLLAGRDAHCLDAKDYLLMPTDDECTRPTAAMHHYVDLSKRGYFRHAWRHVAATRPSP